MEAKHTEGPWHVGIKQAHQIVYDKTGWAVADATVYHGKESAVEMKANANLIAAAPELLTALDELVSYTESCEGMLNASPAGQVKKAHAIITRAKGSTYHG